MSTNPVSMRLPLNVDGKADPQVVEALQNHDDAINDLQQAIPTLKGQITALQNAAKSTPSGTSTTINETGVTSFNGATGVIQFFASLGLVNNQTGVTAYITQTSDNGSLIVLDDASAIAVSLNFAVAKPWYTLIANYGAGTATLMPTQGTITYPGNVAAANMPLPSGFAAFVYFDGTNWWGIAIPIQGGSGTITDVVAGTGLNGGGSSGSVTLNLSDTAVTPGSYTNANITVNQQGQLTAASNGSGGSSYVKGTVSIGPQVGAGTYTASATVTGATVGAAVVVGVVNGTEAGIFSNLLGWVATANTVTIQVTANAAFLGVSLPVVVFP